MEVDQEGNVWFHQSWLDTVDRCCERGRLSLVEPDFKRTNDAALIGTGTHAAIAAVLTDKLNADEIAEFAYRATVEIAERADVQWTKWTLPGQLGELAGRCAKAWAREIMPSVETGGQVEIDFKVPLFKYRDRQIGIAGTMDYVTPSGIIIDWKTASRKFYQREKQRTAIQPTVYSTAAAHGGLNREFEYPIHFRYGVMVRGTDSATTQLVDLQRTHAHEAWLHDKLESYLDLADALGVKRRWPRDEDHHLCNETWCPWWSICKGARLSAAQDLWSA